MIVLKLHIIMNKHHTIEELEHMSPIELGDILRRSIRDLNDAYIKTLIEFGAIPDIKDPTGGTTALHNAAYYGKTSIIKLILNTGVNINIKDDYGYAPIHEAVCCQRIDALKLLISSGCDLNSINNNNITPLHFAVDNENIDIIKILLNAGASKISKTFELETPWDIAAPHVKRECPELNPNHYV